MPIRIGQVYEACDPLAEGRRIRIANYRSGDPTALIVNAHDGKRFRHISVKNLHASDRTKSGATRRTGYVLLGAPA